jgi:predicted DNA-binding transcriptional regulator YafY
MVVGSAVRAREVLRFDYAGGTENPTGLPRRAEAHHLVTWGDRWYLVGYDLDRDDWRTYRADRMTPKTPAGPRFAPRALPAPDVATFVAERFASISPWRSAIRGEALIDRPADEVAAWAGRDALVEALPDGRCRVVLSSWSWDGLAAQMAMFGAPLQIVGPVDLVDATRRLAERVTAAVA